MKGFVRQLAAGLAALSLFGWMELPSEHIHAKSEHGHRVEYVHRHVAAHATDHHDDAAADRDDATVADHDGTAVADRDDDADDHAVVHHDEDAVYLAAPAAALARIALPAPPGIVRTAAPDVGNSGPSHTSLTSPLFVRVHAPPWRDTISRRGPPAFAV